MRILVTGAEGQLVRCLLESGPRRGIEVTVQKDDGQQVKVAQYDDGDVQMGDRVQIVYDSHGVAKAVRDPNPPRG